MQTGSAAETQAPYQASDAIVRVGGWLFRQRSWLPVPIAIGLLFSPKSTTSPLLPLAGLGLVIAGEWLRLCAVHHIGTISRTRSQRVGPLISTGPFGRVRNPLYLGNIALWVGFALSSQASWGTPVVLLLLAAEYHAIVKWEEAVLASRLGDPYRAYLVQVPRWIPSLHMTKTSIARASGTERVHTWRETIFSERGTLIAIAVGYLLLGMKHAALTAGAWETATGG